MFEDQYPVTNQASRRRGKSRCRYPECACEERPCRPGALDRSFLAGRDPGKAVADDRRETFELLAKHGRLSASMALANARNAGFHDYFTMRGAMLAGGLHALRRRGARAFDREAMRVGAGCV